MVSGWVTCFVGMAVAAGWVLDIPALQSISPGLSTMKFNTALEFVFFGVALIGTGPKRAAKGWARAALVIVLLVSALTFTEYLVHIDLGIDQLFIQDKHQDKYRELTPPGRMSPIAAVSFLLLGLGLLSVQFKRKFVLLSQALGTIALSFVLLAVLGYLYGASSLARIYPYSTIAIHSAGTLLVATFGLLSLYPDQGWIAVFAGRDMGSVIGRRLFFGSALIFVVLGFVAREANRTQLFDSAFSAVFIVTVGSLITMVAVGWTSAYLNRSDRLNRTSLENARSLAYQLQLMVDHSPGAAAMLDRQMRYIWASQRWISDFHLEAKELIGKSHYELFPEIPERWKRIHERCLAGAVEKSDEDAFPRTDGSQTWLRWEVRPWRTTEGTIGGLVIFSEDITGMKKAEDALRKSNLELEEKVEARTREIQLQATVLKNSRDTEQRLRGQIEAISQANALISEAVAKVKDTRIEPLLETIALQAQVITGAEMVALGIGNDPEHPFDPWVSLGVPREFASRIGRVPRPLGILGTIARGGHTIRLADAQTHPSYRGLPPGHPAVKSFLGVPIRYAGKAIGNLYLANKRNGVEFTMEDQHAIELLATRAGTAIETARLYQTESKNREWLQAILEQMPEGVIVLDAQGQIINANRIALELTAEAFEAVSEPSPRSRTSNPIPWRELPPVLRAIRSSESSHGFELMARNKSDQLIPILASASPLRSASGEHAGAVLVFQDISLLKEFEKQREEWMSIIAHDLRQPVSVISLSTQLLEMAPRSSRPEREWKMIQNIYTQAMSLDRLIGDLLDVSQIEAKRLSLRLERFDLIAFVQEVIDRLSPLLKDRNISVETRGAASAMIEGDRTRIEQVIGNLLSNAVKYGSAGAAIRLEIDASSPKLRLAVINEGKGISSGELSTLFNRFSRTDGARDCQIKGIGLGLYICKGIIEGHGGRIWAESEPGRVTRFIFELPSLAQTPANESPSGLRFEERPAQPPKLNERA